MLIADGFDEAVLGVARRCGQPDLIAYDVEKIIEILVTRDDMTYEEAVEFFDFNIAGAWMGEETPIFIIKMTIEEVTANLEETDGHNKMEIRAGADRGLLEDKGAGPSGKPKNRRPTGTNL